MGKIDNFNVTIIGHQKGNDVHESIKRNFGMPHPYDYRKALRLMKQSNRPIVTFIYILGAFCVLEAEDRGQGEVISKNLLEMWKINVPIICFVIGEGGSVGELGN